MKNLSFLDKILYLVNTLLAILLLFSFALPYISPKNIPFFAILSLSVPFLLIINGSFFIYWLVKLKKQLLLSLSILVISFFAISPFYKLSAKNSALNDDLKLVSYNVRMFNHWGWTKEKNVTQKIKKFIDDYSPDVIAIQENMLLPKYTFKYPYKYIKKKYERGRFGMAIYSKYPIINKGFLGFKNSSNEIIYADIIRKKDTIRVYNIHLQSLSISPDKENFGKENSEKLIKTLEHNFKKQAIQTETFLAHEKKWKGKKIVCGDFNNTAYSWVYNKISENKKDAFLEAGEGFSKTFRYWFPMRIDFILTDNTANIQQYKSYSYKYSDHFPISARINW